MFELNAVKDKQYVLDHLEDCAFDSEYVEWLMKSLPNLKQFIFNCQLDDHRPDMPIYPCTMRELGINGVNVVLNISIVYGDNYQNVTAMLDNVLEMFYPYDDNLDEYSRKATVVVVLKFRKNNRHKRIPHTFNNFKRWQFMAAMKHSWWGTSTLKIM